MNNSRKQKNSTGRAFTLIELLVVMAIVGILLGLLLPALSSTRRSAQLAGSLSNLRQISIAATEYSVDEEDLWPILPINNPGFRDRPTTSFFEWAYGGQSTSRWWSQTSFFSFAFDRPLNRYIYPDIDLLFDALRNPRGLSRAEFRDSGRFPAAIREDERTFLSVYQCPGDFGSLARETPFDDVLSYSDEAIELSPRDTARTGYEDVGTSYMTNRLHVIELARQRNALMQDVAIWIEAARKIQHASYVSPSSFTWIHDQTMWVVPYFGGTGTQGNFGEIDKGVAGFMDGSARYTTLERRNIDSTTGENTALRTRDYQMVFNRY